MNCAEAQKRIRPYLDGKLPENEMAAFLDHIRNCPDCYDELEIYLAIGETLKNEDLKDDPKDYDFRKKLLRKIENSEYDLKIKKYQNIIARAVILSAVVIMGAIIFSGISQRGSTDIPAWETEDLTGEEETEAVTGSGESVTK